MDLEKFFESEITNIEREDKKISVKTYEGFVGIKRSFLEIIKLDIKIREIDSKESKKELEVLGVGMILYFQFLRRLI